MYEFSAFSHFFFGKVAPKKKVNKSENFTNQKVFFITQLGLLELINVKAVYCDLSVLQVCTETGIAYI